MSKIYRLIWCFICYSSALMGQPAQVAKYLRVDNGLSNNVVNSLYQDRFGFMWMGTYDGLNRYDGYHFKIYRNKWEDDNSLIYNHITALGGDHQDRIWIGTQRGASVFDYADAKIHPVSYFDGAQKVKLTAPINAISTGKNGVVYVGAEDKGLFTINPKAFVANRIAFKNAYNFTVKAITSSKNGLIWLSIKDVGICSYQPGNANLKLVNPTINGANCIAEGKNNNLWIGTENGLFIMDSRSGKIIRADIKLSSENVMSVTADRSQQIWIATNGGGITIFNPQTKQVSYLKAGVEKGLLSSNAVATVYEDQQMRKWIATFRGGVNLIDDKNEQFKPIESNPFKKNTLINNFVLSFAEDAQKNIWIGTDGGGLSVWNPKTDHYSNYVHDATKPQSIIGNFVTSILKDHQNTMWVGTFSGGIDRFDPKSNSFKHYSCFNTQKNITEVNVWKLYEDQQHNIWVGMTKSGALYKFNRQSDKFELFDANLRDIHTLYQDTQGVFWAGNYTNLIQVDLLHKKHRYYAVDYAIRAIHQDKNNNFWVGTEGGGLLSFDKKTHHFTRKIEANGLPSNSILNILEDASGNIWCSTYNGISKYNPLSNKFKNYFATNGLQSNQFNYNAAFKCANGNFLFGGINGFNYFNPDSIKINHRSPELVITDFKINNVSINADPNYAKQPAVVNLKKIDIPFNEAVISVDFSAIEFSFQDQIKYAYYLEGWDRGWNYVDKVNTAYYSRIYEGDYKLHVKSTDTDGAWSNNEKIIEITILPPWHRTWWAYVMYFVVISATYYLFWWYRQRQNQLKHEVEIAKLKVEREKDLNEKKLNFFTNISHELRTPLTLIVNPIKDILNTNTTLGSEKNDLNVVYRNAKRLLSLVDQLLLFRKTESETEALKVVKIDLPKFAKEIFMCFSYLAKNNEINYTFICDDEALSLYADQDKLEIILFNLLSNALKFTPKNGSVSLIIEQQNNQISIKVSDSGMGIPEDVGEKLFDKFYKVLNSTSKKIGFGIGLYLVKNFVALHKGTISYITKQGEGTTFSILLPKGTAEDVLPSSAFENELTYVNELIAQEEQIEAQNKAEKSGNLALLISDLNSILVVDDNEQIIDYIHQIFNDKFKVYRASNGIEGLSISKAVLPDIIISDINMDGLNGIELCRAIKEDQALSHIPVILLTADPSPELRLQGIEVGAYDFISKPFDKALFTAKINGVIKNRKSLQTYFYNEITLKSETYKISQEDKGFLQKCISIIEDNLIESEFNVKKLSTDLGMSHSNLYKKVKTTSGLSINSFVRFIRLRKAAELLINTNLNINEVAFRVGINDIKYFREQFQKQFKLTPSEFVKKHRKTFHKHFSINT